MASIPGAPLGLPGPGFPAVLLEDEPVPFEKRPPPPAPLPVPPLDCVGEKLGAAPLLPVVEPPVVPLVFPDVLPVVTGAVVPGVIFGIFDFGTGILKFDEGFGFGAAAAEGFGATGFGALGLGAGVAGA